MEVFSFVFHFPFPILFPTDMLKFISEKTNKAKQKLIVIFQDNKKVIQFSGGDDQFEHSMFQRENPTADEKDVLCSLSMLELTDRKLRPWANMIPRWFVLKSKSDDCFLKTSDCPACLIVIQTNLLWMTNWLLCAFLII